MEWLVGQFFQIAIRGQIGANFVSDARQHQVNGLDRAVRELRQSQTLPQQIALDVFQRVLAQFLQHDRVGADDGRDRECGAENQPMKAIWRQFFIRRWQLHSQTGARNWLYRLYTENHDDLCMGRMQSRSLRRGSASIARYRNTRLSNHYVSRPVWPKRMRASLTTGFERCAGFPMWARVIPKAHCNCGTAEGSDPSALAPSAEAAVSMRH